MIAIHFIQVFRPVFMESDLNGESLAHKVLLIRYLVLTLSAVVLHTRQPGFKMFVAKKYNSINLTYRALPCPMWCLKCAVFKGSSCNPVYSFLS